MRMIARLLLASLLAAPLGCYAPVREDCSCHEGEGSACRGCGKAVKGGACDCGKAATPKR